MILRIGTPLLWNVSTHTEQKEAINYRDNMSTYKYIYIFNNEETIGVRTQSEHLAMK